MHPIIPYFERIVFKIPFPVVGELKIHSFGILVAMGFLAGSYMSQRKCRRDGLDPEVVNRLLGWIIGCVFIGGHLGHALFYEPDFYFSHPIEFFKVWQGLSSFGGFVACAFVVPWFFYRNRVPVMPFCDTIAYGLTLGWFFGRMGCFSVHDHPGTISNFWLSVPGMCTGGDPAIACHDLGLYEAIWSFGVMLLFVAMDRAPRFPGFYVGWLVTLYGPFRFWLDFMRDANTDVRYLGLTPAQYGSVAITIVGIVLISKGWSKAPWRGRNGPVLPEQDPALEEG